MPRKNRKRIGGSIKSTRYQEGGVTSGQCPDGSWKIDQFGQQYCESGDNGQSIEAGRRYRGRRGKRRHKSRRGRSGRQTGGMIRTGFPSVENYGPPSRGGRRQRKRKIGRGRSGRQTGGTIRRGIGRRPQGSRGFFDSNMNPYTPSQHGGDCWFDCAIAQGQDPYDCHWVCSRTSGGRGGR